jgi:IPT/TIG domain
MAQSALTVTPPSPTPPTNMSCTGATPPNPPNYTKTNYANPFNLDANGRPQAPYGVNPNPPPYFDDGTAGSLVAFATNTAALASGTGATSGGTENSYPGTDTAPFDTPNCVGAVPASTSVAHEGAGTEVVVTQTYPATILNPNGPLQMVSDLGNFVGVMTPAGVNNSPNSQHASSLSPAVNPTLTTAGPSVASGTGTATVTATGTGFTKQSVIWVNGIAYPTTYVSATSLTAVAPKKATAGTLPVNVVTGGVVTTASQNWTFT